MAGLVDTIKGYIEDTLVSKIDEMVPPLLDDTLAGLDPSFSTEVMGQPLDVAFDFASHVSSQYFGQPRVGVHRLQRHQLVLYGRARVGRTLIEANAIDVDHAYSLRCDVLSANSLHRRHHCQ